MNGDPALEGGNVDLVEQTDLAAGTDPAGQAAGARQHRRLLGRRAAREQPAGPSAAPAPPQTSFYSLVPGTGPGVAPVRLEPGTRNLVLARALDKEGAEGESSLVVHVKCRARAAAGPPAAGFTTIPVRILVTDANDHAPEFIGQQPYVINVSETAPVGSVASRDIQALDRDSAGPHSTIHYRVSDEQAAGPQVAGLFAFTNPLEPVLFVAAPLDFETLPSSFALTIVAQDQAEPEPLWSSAQVQVNIIGE